MDKIDEKIVGFSGEQYLYSADPASEYSKQNVQYATASYQEEHDMNPGLIAIPQGDEDIKLAIQHLRKGQCISIKSGGHQYSGVSSTNADGIQLDLSKTYKSPNDLAILPSPPAPDQNKVLVNASVSNSLEEFNAFLGSNGLFVPHGQCIAVFTGGHGQTGGYGQLARGFGLLADHIRAIRMIDYTGTVQNLTKAERPDLFNAILGGSPGNFGVVTHYVIEVHRDQDHWFPDETDEKNEWTAQPRALKAMWPYDRNIFTTLLKEVATMADNPDVPQNFDLGVNVISGTSKAGKKGYIPEIDDKNNPHYEDTQGLFDKDGRLKMPMVVLYAQWCPMNAQDKFNPEAKAWFAKFEPFLNGKNGAVFTWPMSKVTDLWLFKKRREFELPYVKRCYSTNSRSLTKDKWVDTVADRLELVLREDAEPELYKNGFLSVQIQCYGGQNSKFYQERNNGLSYSWRDSTVIQTLDCFYTGGDQGRALAEEYQAGNDRVFNGEASVFSKQDKRVLWATYGDWDMEKAWPYYYETKEQYERIGKQRQLADPNGIFTPNPFNVRPVK